MSDVPKTEARLQAEAVIVLLCQLERENAELRNKLAGLENQSQWQCSCGGTDCEGLKENAALRKALYAQADYQRELRADRDRLDWLEVHGEPVTYEEAPHELVWCVIGERGQRSIRAAIDAARTKEAKP